MGIRLEDLPPKVREQVAQKQLDQIKTTKYHNKKAEREGLTFDSQKEARRYDELMLLLRAGQIKDLRLQQTITIQEAYTKPDGERVRALTYVADFTYKRPRPIYDSQGKLLEIQEEQVVEDVKSKATRTRVYLNKKKQLEAMGISITEV